jgi:hypothetical protein
MKSATLRISILQFDSVEHCFAPSLSITKYTTNGEEIATTEKLTLLQAQFLLGTTAVPSQRWRNDYSQWRNNVTNGSEHGHSPVFDSKQALHAFNDTGKELVARLRVELKSVIGEQQDTTTAAPMQVLVDDFLPLYSSVQVGDTWWHIRDCVYGCVVPIQHLPVSDALKSRLQAWRFQKTQLLLKSDLDRCQLLEECHALEEHIRWELNERGCTSEPALIVQDATLE